MQVTLHSNKPKFARSCQGLQPLGVTASGHSQTVMNVYEIVTQKIVDQLEKGCIPWKQPWHSVKEMPQNLISRKEYHGVNWLLTISSGYASPYWLTYKQAQAIGGQVRKGEHAMPIVYWNFLDSKIEKKADGTPKKIGFLKYYSAFNATQIDGIESHLPIAPDARPSNKIEACERIVASMPNAPVIRNDAGRAVYSPALDVVGMPAQSAFISDEMYYSVLFHELTHSTGHATRLARKGIAEPSKFGSDTYAKEELIAELGAAFLSAKTGIEQQTIDDSASYIANWLAALKSDSKLIVEASGKAQKAANYILNVPSEK